MATKTGPQPDEQDIATFCALVRAEGVRLYRALPWRHVADPFAVLTSEVMLQQTQVSRVLKHWDRWMSAFPTADALAAASTTDVLELWQGMGYHRRALALKRAAEQCSERYEGRVPRGYQQLLELPGVGPATAAGVCVFAWGEPQVYLETNVRAVFLHHFFEGCDQVADREIIPLIEATCDTGDPRGWYYALLDYGNHLKQVLPNPSRRSRHHARQSVFEGSVRQKRAFLLREVLAASAAPGAPAAPAASGAPAAPAVPGVTTEDLLEALNRAERAAARDGVTEDDLVGILTALVAEGFLAQSGEGRWHIAK
jgi:A/G-specific adenine glycosylase